MSDKITVSLDFTPAELRAKAKFFMTLADSLEAKAGAETTKKPDPAPASPPPPPPAPSGESAAEALQHELDEGSEPDAASVFGGADDNAGNTGDIELDADGIPWDGRIHAPSKIKLKKTNTWKLKRGIDKDYAAQVIEELKQTMNAGKPSVPAEPSAPPPAPPAASNSTPPAPPAPPAAESGNVNFSDLVRKITGNLSEGNITNAQVNEMLRTFEIASVPMLKNRPDVWGMVDQHLDSLLQG